MVELNSTCRLDKKTGSALQRQYLESMVLPKSFASATDVVLTMQTVNLWLSKVGGTEGLDPNSGFTGDPPPAPRRVLSAGIPSETVDKIEQSIIGDNATELSELLQGVERKQVSQKLLLNLTQRSITNRSIKCLGLLLGKFDSLDEEDDINKRNIIHRLVIHIGRTKGLIISPQKEAPASSASATSLNVVTPQLFITPAESPISAPPPSANTIECDGTLLLSPEDELVKLLDLVLSSLKTSQRSALAARDSYGRLPLHYAAQYGFVVLCRLLIKYMREWGQYDVSAGVDSAHWQDSDGYAPLHLAVIGEHPMTTKTLLQSEGYDGGVGTSDKAVTARKEVWKSSAVLIMAAKRNCFVIVQLLVEAGVDINYQDENGETALHYTARFGHINCLKALFASGDSQRPDVELTEKTYGWTPLFVAAVEGKKDIAEALIELGHCELDKVDTSGWTAVEHAALRGHLPLARMLTARSFGILPRASSRNTSNGSPPGCAGSTSPPAVRPQTVKSFGHRYLKKRQTMVLVTLGSMDVRKNIQAVRLDQIPVSKAHTTQLDTALSLVVSAQNAQGEPVIINLPVHANVTTDDPILFETQDLGKVKIMFDLVPTYAGSNDRIIGRAVALLNSVKPELGTKKSSLQGGIQVPILSVNTLEVIGSVNFEFSIVTPFEHPNIGITKEHTYWKSMTTPRVIGHRGLGKNLDSRKSLQLGENTLLSFITAAKLGASYVEFDVQLTKDHVPVIYHDFLVGETGIDAPVHTLTLEQFMSMKEEFPAQNSRSGSPDRIWGSEKGDSSPPNTSDGVRTPGLRKIRSMSLSEHDGRQNEKTDRTRQSKAFKKHGFKGNSRGHSIQSPFATLEQTFKALPLSVGFNIELSKVPLLISTSQVLISRRVPHIV